MEYWTAPPEVTSTKMYTGPGSDPMEAAAAAWSQLGAEMKSAAAAYRSIIGQLGGEEWLGPASAAMVTAVAPYLAWMHATGEQAEQAAMQARSASAAFQMAHSMTVPPISVMANRALLQKLVATNVLGQNTPSIAATEAEHHEMWAQDAVAMSGYHAQAAAATKLSDFMSPPNPTNPAGQVSQAAAVSQAAGNSAGTHAPAASGALQSMVNSAAAQSAAGAPPSGAADLLADPNYILGNQTLGNAISSTNLGANNICAVWRGFSGITGAQKLMTEFAKDAAKGAADAAQGMAQGAAGAAQGAANAAGGLGGIAGNLGQAGSIGGLSVPPSWAPPAPPATALGPVSGGSWQPVGPGILGNTPMTPPAGMPGVPGVPAAAGAAGAGFRGFGAPRYGTQLTVMPRRPFGG